MESQQTERYAHSIINAGVDWLTATAKAGDEGRPFRLVGNALLDEERAAGGDVQPAALRDYVGRRGNGFFVGSRPQDSIIVLSGQRASPDFDRVARAAHNVSRIDLQVSVWTHGEQPHIALREYKRLQNVPPSRGRPRSLTFIQSHPKGETLNVNKRSSDAYGRVYDWASAHAAGAERTIWRYEIEFKRRLAWHHSRALLGVANPSTAVRNTVHQWYTDRKLEPTWSIEDNSGSQSQPLRTRSKDILDWFEGTISKTVAKAVNRYGLEAVLLSLGLADKVQPIERSDMDNGSQSTRSVLHDHVR